MGIYVLLPVLVSGPHAELDESLTAKVVAGNPNNPNAVSNTVSHAAQPVIISHVSESICGPSTGIMKQA
jgi:hypothetical protein